MDNISVERAVNRFKSEKTIENTQKSQLSRAKERRKQIKISRVTLFIKKNQNNGEEKACLYGLVLMLTINMMK